VTEDDNDRLDDLEAGGRARGVRLDTLEAHERDRPSFLRENWYRDVWLFLITVFVVGATLAGISENQQRIDEIQESRYQFQLANCQSVNARNLSAKAKARETVSPEGQRTVRLLIDEMLPFYRDCEARAREGVEIPPD
jgi:hypothetical protein